MCILDSRDQVLRLKTVRLVRVLWRHYGVEESTWEREDTIRARCICMCFDYDCPEFRDEIPFKEGRM